MCANKWLMLNSTVIKQYLKPFNFEQKMNIDLFQNVNEMF